MLTPHGTSPGRFAVRQPHGSRRMLTTSPQRRALQPTIYNILTPYGEFTRQRSDQLRYTEIEPASLVTLVAKISKPVAVYTKGGHDSAGQSPNSLLYKPCNMHQLLHFKQLTVIRCQ